MKRCVRCSATKEEFPRNSKSRDGLGSWCNDCCRDYMRNRKSDPEKRRFAAKQSSKRHPDKRRAREQVKEAVRKGTLKPIKTLKCIDCGRNAVAYDHFCGYEQPLTVEPVCSECHGLRSRKRGEHRRTWDEMPAIKAMEGAAS